MNRYGISFIIAVGNILSIHSNFDWGIHMPSKSVFTSWLSCSSAAVWSISWGKTGDQLGQSGPRPVLPPPHSLFLLPCKVSESREELSSLLVSCSSQNRACLHWTQPLTVLLPKAERVFLQEELGFYLWPKGKMLLWLLVSSPSISRTSGPESPLDTPN